MTAYMIARVEVTDPGRMAEYLVHTPRILQRFGGRFVARGAAEATLEGEPEAGRVVVMEFPSVRAAHDFYNSDEYQRAAKIRQEASTGQFIIVDGYDDAAWAQALAASKQHCLD